MGLPLQKITKIALILSLTIISCSLFAFGQRVYAAGEKYVLSADDSVMTVSGGAFSELTPQPLQLKKHLYEGDKGTYLGRYTANALIKPGVASNCEQTMQVSIVVSIIKQKPNIGFPETFCGKMNFDQENLSYTSVKQQDADPNIPTTKLGQIRGTTVTVTQGKDKVTPPPTGNDTSKPEQYTFNGEHGDSITAKDGFFNQFNKSGVTFNYATAATVGSGFACNDGSVICYTTNLSAGSCSEEAVILFNGDTLKNAKKGNVNLDAKLQLGATYSGNCSSINWKKLWTPGKQTQTPIKVSGNVSGFLYAPEKRIDPPKKGDNNDPNADPTCGGEGTSMSWIICPIFNLTKSAGDIMNNVVTSQLNVDTDPIFGSENASAKDKHTAASYKGAWSAMRNIALIIIIISGLIMVIAQAVGSQAIDAYTIKSVMPRLLIAAILIALSWIIMEFCVNITNLLGEGIRELIYSPFSGLTGNQGAVLSGQNAITILTSGVAVVGGIILLLCFAGTIAIALLVGFLIIVLRQILLVFLIIVAPIAIALYALPNTKKAFSLWWDNFIKLLLMFPIIVGFIAVGRVFSAVSLAEGGFVNSIIATIAYILPFFLLPMTFKFAGSAMGGIAQGVHGFGQKMNAGVKKRRAERWAGRREKFKNGELFSEQTPFKSLNKVGGRVNKIGAGLGHGGFWGAYGLNKMGKANLERLSSAQRDEKLKQPGVQDLLQDDDVRMAMWAGDSIEESEEAVRKVLKFRANKAVSEGTKTREEADKEAAEKQRSIMAAVKSIGFDSASRLAAWRMEAAQGKGRGLNALADANGIDDSTQMSKIIESIAGGTGVDQTRLLQDTMFAFGQGARVDLREQDLGSVLGKRFDTRMISSVSDRGMKRIAAHMTDRAGHTGLYDQDRNVQVRTAAQLLATQESLTQMAEPTRNEFVKRMSEAKVFDYESTIPREMELARQIEPAHAAAFDAAQDKLKEALEAQEKAQLVIDNEKAGGGTPSKESMDKLVAAKASVEAAKQSAEPHLTALSKLATEIRATSSTYGQAIPYAAREGAAAQGQQQPPPGPAPNP